MPSRLEAWIFSGSTMASTFRTVSEPTRTSARLTRAPFSIATADPATRRKLPEGEIVGGAGRYGSQAWLGIPFAKPPVGELRWRAPRPGEPWSGLREALAPPAPCVQYASPMGGVDTAPANTPVGREDCLALNVWAPPFEIGRAHV